MSTDTVEENCGKTNANVASLLGVHFKSIEKRCGSLNDNPTFQLYVIASHWGKIPLFIQICFGIWCLKNMENLVNNEILKIGFFSKMRF